VTGDEDNRNDAAGICKFGLKFQPAHAGQAYIEDQATGPSVRLVAKKSDAEANTSTLSATERIKLLRAARIDTLSSMTKTIGASFPACRMRI
jgi:hypothetical protein